MIMLKDLVLLNVGPAPRMHAKFAPRVNLITGDNGLGKSFLLDSAWWAVTRSWPAEVNRRMTFGLEARPRNVKEPASIWVCVDDGTALGKPEYSGILMPGSERWVPSGGERPRSSGLLLYAHADGSFSVWDPVRNGWYRDSGRVKARRPPYVFTETEVWDGLRNTDRSGPRCNGLLHDWSSWIKAGDANGDAMAEALRALSPDSEGGDGMAPGPPTRLSLDDVRDIPTIRTGYAGAVPVLHASAGIRRVIALAYIITWAWSEHRIAAGLQGAAVTSEVTMLFDEVESHLHPRWQRSILKALKDVGSALLDGAGLQLIASTHSPLVLASAEPWFDPDQDAWLDLDLEGDPPEARLRRRTYTPRGTPGAWLTSEAFDLRTERGSIEAEQAVLRARELLRKPDASLDEVMEVHAHLRRVLPDVDRIWVRWNAFVEERGGTP